MAQEILNAVMSKLADVYYPVNHYLITSTNTNPNNLGIKGTWVLKSKTLKRNLVDLIGTDGTLTPKLFTVNSTNFTLSGLRIRSDGSVPYLAIWGFNKVALSDTDKAIGTINYDALGSDILQYYVYTHGTVNSAGVMVMVTVQNKDAGGGVYITDIIANNSATSYAAQSSYYVYVRFPLLLATNNGLYYKDELCDQFHWLRTA